MYFLRAIIVFSIALTAIASPHGPVVAVGPSTAKTTRAAPTSNSSGLEARDAFPGTHVGDGTSFARVLLCPTPSIIVLSATFYATGPGSCGITNVDTDLVVAISSILFNAYPCVVGFYLWVST